MAFKFSKGDRKLGDIAFEDDSDTGIDFGSDSISLETGGTARLTVTDSVITTTLPIHISGSVTEGLRIAKGETDYREIQFEKDGTDTAFIQVNSAEDLVIGCQSNGDEIIFQTTIGGSLTEAMRITADNKVGINTNGDPDYTLDVAGNIGLDEYIYHNGDADTWMKFGDNSITFKAGNISFINLDKKASAPHELTINDGGNNIDFIVKGNGSNEGNPLFKCDASTGRVGINGVGSPDCELHVDGDVKVVGDDPRIKIDGDTNSHPGLELYENGTRKWIVYNDYTNDNLTFKTDSTVRMSIEQDGNVGIATASPVATLNVNGSYAGKITSVTSSPYTVTDTDWLLVCSGGSAKTINLPAASNNTGRILHIKDGGANANSYNITLDGNSSETIDGSTTHVINQNRASVTIVCDGSGWVLISVYSGPPP